MLCRNCGRELSETDKFCITCGTPVEQEEQPAVFAEAETPAPVAKRKKNLLIPIVALVAVVGIVAALVLSGVFANPSAKLLKAAANSWKAWSEAAVLDAEDLGWLLEAQEEYSGEYQLWLEDFPELVQLEGFGLRASFDFSQTQRQFGMVLAPTYGYADIVHAQIVLKDNELYIGSQELTKDAYYMIHTDLLGQELNALGAGVPEIESMGFNLFDMVQPMKEAGADTQESIQNLSDVTKNIVEQVQVEKAEGGEIDVNGTALKADAYHVLIPQAAVSAVMDALEPVFLAQDSNDAMMEMYRSMGMDDETLAMMEMSLQEATAMNKESFDEARKVLEELGDLELDVFVSDNYVVAAEFAITYDGVTVDFRIALGGGENYVDNISISGEDQDGEGFLLVSEGDHGAKSGAFTDKTTITIGGDMDTVVTSQLRYAPDAESDNLSWTIGIQDDVENITVDMNGQLTLGVEEFFLRIEELKLAEGDYTLGAFGFEYRLGQYAPQQVDTSNYKVLAEMTSADMNAALNSLMGNAMEWLSWVQQNFPELMSLLM